MHTIPIKKYRAKKALKWLKKNLFSRKWLIKKLIKKWQRKDLNAWPEPDQRQINEINRYEYSFLSQNGEDGILRYIFSKIGYESRYFVEFGFGAHQCNSLKLMLHENFHGLLMDGSEEQCDIFNRACEGISQKGVKAINTFIDLENLEELIISNEVPSEIDFLCIDVDGNDYWFWEKLTCIRPRVVCIEYNSGIGPNQARSISYKSDFERFTAHPSGFFAGASLRALESLGVKKGYRLVACDSTGTNTFFLREDIGNEVIKTLSCEEAFYPHLNWLSRGISEAKQYEIMQSLPYIDV